jgi:hypothetical protein
MIKNLGFLLFSILLVGLVGCSGEKTDMTAKENKVNAAKSVKDEVKAEVSFKSNQEITELTEQVAKDFYELFSKKIINLNNSTISQPVDYFFEKPLEPGFFYGLPAGAKYENATDEVAVYYQLLNDIIGMPLETTNTKQETHTYTLVENTDEKITLHVDYKLVAMDKTFNEKRVVVLILVNKQVKIEQFEALESPVVDIMQKANK